MSLAFPDPGSLPHRVLSSAAPLGTKAAREARSSAPHSVHGDPWEGLRSHCGLPYLPTTRHPPGRRMRPEGAVEAATVRRQVLLCSAAGVAVPWPPEDTPWLGTLSPKCRELR